MRLRRFRFCKTITRAIVLLVLTAVGFEIFLRHDESQKFITAPVQPSVTEFTVPMWDVHHGLIPSANLSLPTTDSSTSIVVQTNSLGIRGPEYKIPKPPQTYRIVCLGDEHVLAPEVSFEETFCAQLRSILQPLTTLDVEVINAGVPGYCPLLSCLQLKHRLASLQPDLVVLCANPTDIHDDYEYRRLTTVDRQGMPLLCSNPELEIALQRKQPPLHLQSRAIQWVCTRAGCFWKNNWETDAASEQSRAMKASWVDADTKEWTFHVRHALSAVGNVRTLSRQLSARFFVALYPISTGIVRQSSRELSESTLPSSPAGSSSGANTYRVISQYAAETGIVVLDPEEFTSSRNEAREDLLEGTSQLSPTGHSLYAQKLAKHIVTNDPSLWNNRFPVEHARHDSDQYGRRMR